MEHRSKLSYWDRAELLETVKETYQQLHGVRPKPGLYDELEIKAAYISVTLKENNFDNFKMFVNYLKVKKAKELINSGYLRKYNIEALSKACGFKATNSFYRIFKNETGLTPKQFSEKN